MNDWRESLLNLREEVVINVKTTRWRLSLPHLTANKSIDTSLKLSFQLPVKLPHDTYSLFNSPATLTVYPNLQRLQVLHELNVPSIVNNSFTGGDRLSSSANIALCRTGDRCNSQVNLISLVIVYSLYSVHRASNSSI